MSSDDPNRKPLEDPPIEDEEVLDLLSGMRSGPPKFHARVTKDSKGATAAAYAHAPRDLPKGKDTFPGDMSPVLVNVTPVPPPSGVRTDPGLGAPLELSHVEESPEEIAARHAPTNPGPRPRRSPLKDDLAGIETVTPQRQTSTKNALVLVAIAAATLFVVVSVVLMRRDDTKAPTPVVTAANTVAAMPSIPPPPPLPVSVAAPVPPTPPPTVDPPAPPTPRASAKATALPSPAPSARRPIDSPPAATRETPSSPQPPPAPTPPPSAAHVPGLEDLVPTKPK